MVSEGYVATGGQRQERRDDRQRAMAEFIMRQGNVQIERLVDHFNVSLMTVHRDLDGLEERGLLRKSRGMATAVPSSLVESSEIYRMGRESREKEAIAHACLELVEPGQSVFLDDSTSALEVARVLEGKAPLTVITNTLTTINLLAELKGITVIALGGTYLKWRSAFMDGTTVDAISKLRADVAILSASAVSDDIAFHQSSQSADVKRAMIRSAARRVLLLDHTKFAKRALHAVASLKDFDAVVVDWATPQSDLDRLRAQGIHVVAAQPRPVGRGRRASTPPATTNDNADTEIAAHVRDGVGA